MSCSLRPATAGDVDFMWEMLYEASYAADDGVPDAAALRGHPVLARYVEGWGRHGDLGVMASDDETGQPVGAAWLRLLTGDAKGFGYVDDETPELAIAVAPRQRGRGVGEQMLRELLDAAAGTFAAVSLSVRADNPALRLHERVGFQVVGRSDVPGEPGATSLTMTITTGRSRRRC